MKYYAIRAKVCILVPGVLISGYHEEGKAGREVDFLVADPDEHSAAGLGELLVEHGRQDGIDALHVLDEQRTAEPQTCLQVLDEAVVRETGLSDLAVLIHLYNELHRLTRRVDDQRVPVEPAFIKKFSS